MALIPVIVEANLGLAKKEANRLSRSTGEPFEDLYHEGAIGLRNAVIRFDPNNGSAFSSFATAHIRGEIMHHLNRRRGGTPKVSRTDYDLYQKVKHLPEPEAMRQLGVDWPRWHQIKGAGTVRTCSFEINKHDPSVDDSDVEFDHLPSALVSIKQWLQGLDEGERSLIGNRYVQFGAAGKRSRDIRSLIQRMGKVKAV